MIDSFYIAWKYISFNKLKTATIVASITLISFLPFSLELLLRESEAQLMNRAVSTPLVVGAKGSALDLLMNTLYFDEEVPEMITLAASEQVRDSDLALPVPLYIRFRARGFPIIGTTLDYFEFRSLQVADGRMLTVLGECVLGALAAERLGLTPGDTIVSSPENLFDLAGVYPLKMKVVGVIESSHTSDDLGVFVDLKTAWVIQGLGHGHQKLQNVRDPSLILKRNESNISASAKLEHYMEITDANIDSFHFHGDLSVFPITAVIAVPYDQKSATILQGRYLPKEEPLQIVKSVEVIDGLLQSIFRIKNILDAVILVVGLATVLAIILVFALSLRLREAELKTIFKLGCSKSTTARLLGAEIFIVVVLSAVLCGAMVFVVQQFSHDLVRVLFIN